MCAAAVQVQCARVRACAQYFDSAEDLAAKLASTELAWKVIDEAVQLHGGAGFMWEYPVARMLADARVPRIYGGSNEIMKELIARTCKVDA